MSIHHPSEITAALARIKVAVQSYPKAAMFALADEGYTSLFEQLVSCMISIRTYDEVSLPVSRQLFERARTPAAMAQLSPATIQTLIGESTYADRKAEQIWAIAQQIMADYGGELPAELEVLLSFKGVGPKCAHLALGIACRQPHISVDTHVHRVVNRWGLVHTKTPEKTAQALTAHVPKDQWIQVNEYLMPFGKQICIGTLPQCSTCPVGEMCPQIGVDRHR
ncbi:MAG: endonuclease III [Synechococcales bacterium]|nr:endonuclease III [Synechococcales bacterium]